MLFPLLHRSQLRPHRDVCPWRPISGGSLSCSEVTGRHFRPVSSPAGPEESDFIQGAWSCRTRERGRENKHSLRKDALHEFPKNLKDKYCKLAGGPEEACGQWVWPGSFSQPTLSSLLAAFIQLSQKMMSLHASRSLTVSFINFQTTEFQ